VLLGVVIELEIRQMISAPQMSAYDGFISSRWVKSASPKAMDWPSEVRRRKQLAEAVEASPLADLAFSSMIKRETAPLL